MNRHAVKESPFILIFFISVAVFAALGLVFADEINLSFTSEWDEKLGGSLLIKSNFKYHYCEDSVRAHRGIRGKQNTMTGRKKASQPSKRYGIRMERGIFVRWKALQLNNSTEKQNEKRWYASIVSGHYNRAQESRVRETWRRRNSRKVQSSCICSYCL